MSPRTISRAVYDGLGAADLATANSGLVTDIIACPGLDYCALANARSIPVAQRISERFGDIGRQRRDRRTQDQDLGLHQRLRPPPRRPASAFSGVEKKGEEFYQISLGGSGDEHAAIGEIVGRGFSSEEIVDAVETIVETYIARRATPGRDLPRRLSPRLGQAPFKEASMARLDALASRSRGVRPFSAPAFDHDKCRARDRRS